MWDTRQDLAACFTWKRVGDRVSQSSLKTGGGATLMVHVASSRRSRGDEAEVGRVDATSCIGLFYPNFAVFIVLGHKSSLVICFPIIRTPKG
jgi:hypothetical protein